MNKVRSVMVAVLVVGALHLQLPTVVHATPMSDVNVTPLTQTELNDTADESRTIRFDEQTMQELGNILVVILVLSIVFEIALTPIFKWSIFIKYFADKGLRTPITVGLALLAFWAYGLDIFRDLMNVLTMGDRVNTSFWGQVLTALLIAGGSGSVYEIFNKLGIQDYEKRKREVLDEEISADPGQVVAAAVVTAPANRTVPTVR